LDEGDEFVCLNFYLGEIFSVRKEKQRSAGVSIAPL
jgi:hypothetical protein